MLKIRQVARLKSISSGLNDRVYVCGITEPIWKVAINDCISGLKNSQLWMFLGWQDIRQRYRRSVLGPFWLTISTGIMVAMMGTLYGRLFKLPLDVYIPYLAVGTVVWTLIASIINESCNVFTSAESLIKQTRMPLSLHVYRMIWRNLVIFFHNAVILFFIKQIYGWNIGVSGFVSFAFGLFAIAINAAWIGISLGSICARYRDVSQIILNLTQVAFLITPIMWLPSILEGRVMGMWLIEFNPFYHFVEIVRAPILQNDFPRTSWRIVSIVSTVGCFCGMYLLGRVKKRVAYWL